MDDDQFIFGQEKVADIKLRPGDTGTTLSDQLSAQVDMESFYSQETDQSTFGMVFTGEDSGGHEGGKAVAMTLASIVGMFIVQRVKKFVETTDGPPKIAIAHISLEFE
jgi:hypothetical protein